MHVKRTVSIWDWVDVLTPTTRCKHGELDCPRCGTTSRRDVLHRTQGGLGKVGKLRRKAAR